MNDLEGWLAARARELGLDAVKVEQADPEMLRVFCEQVLNELAARGVLAGTQDIGCYTAPRQEAN